MEENCLNTRAVYAVVDTVHPDSLAFTYTQTHTHYYNFVSRTNIKMHQTPIKYWRKIIFFGNVNLLLAVNFFGPALIVSKIQQKPTE